MWEAGDPVVFDWRDFRTRRQRTMSGLITSVDGDYAWVDVSGVAYQVLLTNLREP